MGTIASLIISLAIVFSTVYSDEDQRKHQSFASLAFSRKMFLFDDVIMWCVSEVLQSVETSLLQVKVWWLLSQFPPFRYFNSYVKCERKCDFIMNFATYGSDKQVLFRTHSVYDIVQCMLLVNLHLSQIVWYIWIHSINLQPYNRKSELLLIQEKYIYPTI